MIQREYEDMAEIFANFTWHDGVGSVGAMILVAAYYRLQTGGFDGESALYFGLNGVGAALILGSLTVAFNFAAFAITVEFTGRFYFTNLLHEVVFFSP